MQTSHTSDNDKQLAVILPNGNKMYYASFGKRFCAWLIDLIIFFMIAVIINVLLAPTFKIDYRQYSLLVGYSISFTIQTIVYYPLLESKGGTFGKRLLRIMPLSLQTKEAPSYSAAFARSLFSRWALVIGTLLNVSLILYANAHTAPDEDSADIVRELYHPYQVSITTRLRRLSMHNETTFVYKEPIVINGALSLAFIVFSGIGGCWVLFSKSKQTWGDRFSNTIVVKD